MHQTTDMKHLIIDLNPTEKHRKGSELMIVDVITGKMGPSYVTIEK